MVNIIILVLFLLGADCTPLAQFRSGCSISVNDDLGEPQPLLLSSSGDSFYYPQENDVISLKKGENIRLVCPGSNLILNSNELKISVGTAKCVSGSTLQIAKKNVAMKDITCKKNSEATARFTGETCEGDNKEIEIGFEVEDEFLRLIQICFDDQLGNTLYSHFTLIPNIDGSQTSVPRPSWKNDKFYIFGKSHDANTLYTQKKQKTAINALVGLTDSSDKYVNTKNYLARGHFTAKSDFVFGSEQRTTFHMINAAPQWQPFNDGNWKIVETNVRTLAAAQGLTLEVYTGTYGILSLPHEETNKNVDIYLYTNATHQALPVPLLYWKFLYEPKTEAGVVVIGVNNPYIEDVSEAIVCDDISEQITWGKWTKGDITDYIYVCSAKQFAQIVEHFPKVTIKSDLIV